MIYIVLTIIEMERNNDSALWILFFEKQLEGGNQWWKSGGDMKTINEIVKELRGKGELNEEALKNAKRQYKNLTKLFIGLWLFFFFCMIVLKRGGGDWIALAVLSVLGYILYKQLGEQAINKAMLLYTFGKKTSGKITNLHLVKQLRIETVRRIFPKGLLIAYSFQDKDNITQTGEFFVRESDIKINSLENIMCGDAIDIIYLSESSDINTIFTKNFNNIYNIKE